MLCKTNNFSIPKPVRSLNSAMGEVETRTAPDYMRTLRSCPRDVFVNLMVSAWEKPADRNIHTEGILEADHYVL